MALSEVFLPGATQKSQTLRELKELQRITLSAIIRPLTDDETMQEVWIDGRDMRAVASEFIRPNDRLSSFERLEIYNRQYWFRLIDILNEDFPGLRAVLGEEKFGELIRAYLAQYPSRSFSLRELGRDLPKFVEAEPKWTAPRQKMALDMARFEWAQTLAFDEGGLPALSVDNLLGRDPEKLQLGLQPYLTLLEMDYPHDTFSLVVRRDALRSDASNAAEMNRRARRRKAIRLPRKKKVFVAVHRFNHSLYYKRLERDAYILLCALRDGQTLADAIAAAMPEDAKPSWGRKIRPWFESWAGLGWFTARG